METYMLNKDQAFSLADTIECGQFFRWEKKDDWYYVTTKDLILKINSKIF